MWFYKLTRNMIHEENPSRLINLNGMREHPSNKNVSKLQINTAPSHLPPSAWIFSHISQHVEELYPDPSIQGQWAHQTDQQISASSPWPRALAGSCWMSHTKHSLGQCDSVFLPCA